MKMGFLLRLNVTFTLLPLHHTEDETVNVSCAERNMEIQLQVFLGV